jgi:hypothetical protein
MLMIAAAIATERPFTAAYVAFSAKKESVAMPAMAATAPGRTKRYVAV